MMNKIEVRTDQGDLFTLLPSDVTTGYDVIDITGLDPGKATIVATTLADTDGEDIQSTRREKRNIVMKLGLEADYAGRTVRQLRDRLYAIFVLETQVNIRFYLDQFTTVEINGYVESLEAPHFTQTPEATISIICENPDFVSIASVSRDFVTTDKDKEEEVNYEGSTDAGFTFRLLADRDFNGFVIYHRRPDNSLRRLEFLSTILAGDTIDISTVTGAKGAWITRNGVRTSALYSVPQSSTFFHLFPGSNYIRVQAEGVSSPYSFIYRPRYGGL